MRKKRIVSIMIALLVVSIGMMHSRTALADDAAYVYHKHTGSSETGGDCYSLPDYHEHVGSETEGGACYETPIYHIHEGNDKSGGGCYGTIVYHTHRSAGEAGSCYSPIYHSHSEDCYERVSSSEWGCTVVRVEQTDKDDYEDHDYNDYYMSCGEVVHGINPAHIHLRLACRKGSSTIVDYKLSCGKNGQTVDGYALSCPKTSETVDAFALSCPKTGESIDSYLLGCGREEGAVLGRLVVSQTKINGGQSARLEACFQDMSEGELSLEVADFVWYDGSGNQIGTGTQLDVSENGTYYVMASLMNDDVASKSMKAEANVSSVVKPTPKPEPVKKEESSNSGEKDSSEKDRKEQERSEDEKDNTSLKEETASKNDKSMQPGVTPQITEALVTKTPQIVIQTPPADKDTENAKKVVTPTKSAGPKTTDSGISGEAAKREGVQAPTQPPVLVIEKEKVELQEMAGENTEELIIEQIETTLPKEAEKEGDFLQSPVAKVITVTVGSLMIAVGLFLIGFLLRWSVRVYNDDGNGNLQYLGRCMIRAEEEGYFMVITEEMVEQSITNRYCLKSDLFHLFKEEEDELVVEKRGKRTTVLIRKEMIAVI